MNHFKDRNVEKCPICEIPVIFKTYSDFIVHIGLHSRQDAQQKLLVDEKNRRDNREGSVIARVYKKILSINSSRVVNANREKFADEYNRNDDFWKKCMIVCPECYRFEYPHDEQVHRCGCGAMMGRAKRLIRSDSRFKFVQKFL